MQNAVPVRVQLGSFEFDLKAGELRTHGRKVRLQEQPFQILLMLVERSGDLVTLDEIKKKLWPNDTVVEFDHSIHTAIKKLRRALDDSADNPTYIETVARRGYRLIVPVECLESAPGDQSSSDVGLGSDSGTAVPMQPAPGLIGKKVSHYRVLEVIGGGGMGMVYKAEDLKLGRQVALKFLPEELLSDPIALQRFEREARTASSLDHPNICTIYAVEEHEEQPFIAMQLLEGETLRDRLARAVAASKALPLDELLDIAAQAARGLQAAHDKGIIHRDIKPANIFLTSSGQVKILDFGLAKLSHAAQESDSDGAHAEPASPSPHASLPDATLTRIGVAMGTAGYMSPEQVRGEKLDSRSDQFSFGLVLYEMATGRRAFSGKTAAIVHDAIINQKPTPVGELATKLPPKLEELIDKALEKDRERRYHSAAEMLGAVESIDLAARPRSTYIRRWRLIASAAVILTAIVIAALYWRSHRAIVLSDKDTIVLADFDNSTGDPVFDGTLKQALALQLEQSPFLSVLSDQRVNETLKQMNHPVTERLTETTAQEVCTRLGSKAVLAGSIAPAGRQYRIALKTVDCQSGDTLEAAEAEAADRQKVLSALGDAASQLRRKVGESLHSVETFNKPLEEATTSSLDALQAYTRGREKQAEQGDAAAIPYFKLAVDLDPNFAYGYVALATSYFGLFEFQQAAVALQKAFDLRERVTQRERFAIEGYYYDWVTGEQEKMGATHKEWARTYPRDYIPHVRLSAYYRFTGQFENAVSEARQAFDLAPNNAVAAYYLMMAEFRRNRFEDAKAVAREAQARGLDSPSLRLGRYLVAFSQQDYQTMEDLVRSSASIPLAADLLFAIHSETHAYQGKLKQAHAIAENAADLATKANAPERAAYFKVEDALRSIEAGFPDRARNLAEESLALSTSLDVKATAALIFALAGDVARARSMADELAQEHPLDTGVRYNSLPMVRAAIALRLNKPEEAVLALDAALPYELGGTSVCCMAPAYLRGLAYLQAGNGQRAAAEFQKLIDHPGVVENQIRGALAHLQLGRAQVMSGNKVAATRSYREFLDLWKGADLDIPVYRQAKAEYAKLQ